MSSSTRARCTCRSSSRATRGCVQSQLARVGEQMLIVERSLSPEQEIVHLPELALRACRLRHLGRGLGVRVRLDHGEVPEHKADALPQVVQHALQLGERATAERALEIRVLDERSARVGRPQHVVPRADVHGE